MLIHRYIFATGLHMIKCYSNNPDKIRTQKHVKGDVQMVYRWRKYELTHQFTNADEIENVPICIACFANLAMLDKEL